MYVKNVGELREYLADVDPRLPVLIEDGLMTAVELSEYSDDTGTHECVVIEVDE